MGDETVVDTRTRVARAIHEIKWITEEHQNPRIFNCPECFQQADAALDELGWDDAPTVINAEVDLDIPAGEHKLILVTDE